MTFHSYVYFNLGSQSYLQNAVPNMWMRWADFSEWVRNKVINSLATSTSNLFIFIYWMRKCFSFWKYCLCLHANCCLRLDLKRKDDLPRVYQQCFRGSSELFQWLWGASNHMSWPLRLSHENLRVSDKVHAQQVDMLDMSDRRLRWGDKYKLSNNGTDLIWALLLVLHDYVVIYTMIFGWSWEGFFLWTYCRGIVSPCKYGLRRLSHLLPNRSTISHCCSLFCLPTSNWFPFWLHCCYNHRTMSHASGSDSCNCSSSSYRLTVGGYCHVSIIGNNPFLDVLNFGCDVIYATENTWNAVRDTEKWRVRCSSWWSHKEPVFGLKVEFFCDHVLSYEKWNHFESIVWLRLPLRCFYATQLHCLVSSPSPQVEALFGGMVT